MYMTLKERMEKRHKFYTRVRHAYHIAGYTLAAFTITGAMWLYMVGLLVM